MKHVDSIVMYSCCILRVVDLSFNLEIKLKRARKAFAGRHFLDAREHYRQALAKFPKNAHAHQGYLLSQSAIADSNFASTHPPMRDLDQIGNLLVQGKAKEAAKQAYSLAPRFPDAHCLLNLLGVAATNIGHPEDAIKAFTRAVHLKPNYMEARANLANRMMAQSQFQKALQIVDGSLQLKPDDAINLNAMTVCLIHLGRFEEALKAGRKAVDANPKNAEAHNNLGICYRRLEKWNEASRCYARALEINPEFTNALNNLGLALVKQGRPLEGIDLYKRCLDLNGKSATTHQNLGLAYLDLRRFDDAIRHFDSAIEIDENLVDSNFNKFIALALDKKLHLAWPYAECRFDSRRSVPVDYRYEGEAPQWDGKTPLEGKNLLVHAEQGLGDTLMFFRYLEHLPHLAEAVLVAVQEPLESLLARQSVNFDVTSLQKVSTGEGRAVDFQCPLMSLPYLLGKRMGASEAPESYLTVPSEIASTWHNRLGSAERLRVGFAFRGNPDHQNNKNRSIDLKTFLTALPEGADYHFLGVDLSKDELDLFATRSDLHCHAKCLLDFSDTAALISLMDHVVTIDTSVAHLAGALGINTSLLLAFIPDWRWGLDVRQSNWYRSVSLFRQETPGNWTTPATEVASLLRNSFG